MKRSWKLCWLSESLSGAPGAFNSIENSVEFRNNKRSGTPASVPMSFSCAASRMSRLPPFAVCHQRTSGRARAISCLTRARCRSRSGFLRKLLHSKQFGRGRFAGLMQQFTNCDVPRCADFPPHSPTGNKGLRAAQSGGQFRWPTENINYFLDGVDLLAHLCKHYYRTEFKSTLLWRTSVALFALCSVMSKCAVP